MFVRIIVIDPEPEDDRDDALVFQMPEHSRNIKLFTKLLDDAGIEWVQMEAPVRKRSAEEKRVDETMKEMREAHYRNFPASDRDNWSDKDPFLRGPNGNEDER